MVMYGYRSYVVIAVFNRKYRTYGYRGILLATVMYGYLGFHGYNR